MSFKYNLDSRIAIKLSGKVGTIVGRSDSIDCSDQYRVEYTNNDSEVIRTWFFESQLEPTIF